MIGLDEFGWTDFYTKFASKLLEYKDNRQELIKKFELAKTQLRNRLNIDFLELEENGEIESDIDPFSIFAIFNGTNKESIRSEIIKELAATFSIFTTVPTTFKSIPTLNGMNRRFFATKSYRNEGDIDKLWNVFIDALNYAEDENEKNRKALIKSFDEAYVLRDVKNKLTQALYWIRPYDFITLDSTNREFLDNIININKKKIASHKLTGEEYLDIIDQLNSYLQNNTLNLISFPEVSDYAYNFKNDKSNQEDWLPKDYHPGLNVEEWEELLYDRNIFTDSGLAVLKRMMDNSNQGTCSSLATKYGNCKNFYNTNCSYLGKRIAKEKGIEPYFDGETNRYWPIAFLGKTAPEDTKGSFIYKIRPELLEALKKFDLSDIKLYEDDTPVPNYWWLNANPKQWRYSDIAIGEVQCYTLVNENGNKRRIYQNFLDAKPGDKVIGYESYPVKQIVALCEISSANDGEYLYFEKTENLVEPISYSTIKSIPELANMEYLVNPQGSLFKLTSEEYYTIYEMIRKPDNSVSESYTKNDFLEEVYIDDSRYDKLKNILLNKKNVILQGAPGVGKTFAAKRLAYSIMGKKDDSKIELVQFHQNYSYEDFVMGYKPEGDSFELKNGVFYRFCKRAENNPNDKFFFIIDEINRGNLSKIFGELLMLIEKDYRGTSATLAYNDIQFSVPENLYIIGMMNTADRSLAMIDYALRRRFSFFKFEPGFESKGFKNYQSLLENKTFDKLIAKVEELNNEIANDSSLGKGFCIGHSYFCGIKSKEDCTEDLLKSIVEFDIIPMLEEYWFDDENKINKWTNALNEVFK